MTYIKDPNALLDYQWDWSQWLATSETISSHTVIIPTGITISGVSAATTTAVTVWLSGGTVGKTYHITCRITTNQGRTDDRTISIQCMER